MGKPTTVVDVRFLSRKDAVVTPLGDQGNFYYSHFISKDTLTHADRYMVYLANEKTWKCLLKVQGVDSEAVRGQKDKLYSGTMVHYS